jgi:tRNA-specific 2-thiouridylase
VLGIEPVSGTVRVGPASALDVRTVEAERPVWAAGDPPDRRFGCEAQVRAHGGRVGATAEVEGDRVVVALDEPLRGVAPGQAVAFYRPDPDGDVVLGSATISTTT